MNSPAFIIEGDLEKDFLEKVCSGKTVRKIGANGDSVALQEIARRVASHIRLVCKRCSPIVVIFDREGRAQSAEEIEREILRLIKLEGIDVDVIVSVADRQIENWILADKETHRERFNYPDGMESFEGVCGKAYLKRFLRKETKYSETIHGSDWLKRSDAANIAKRSTSFRRLSENLLNLGCWWLEPFKLSAE